MLLDLGPRVRPSAAAKLGAPRQTLESKIQAPNTIVVVAVRAV
jgi:hypothetical protein